MMAPSLLTITMPCTFLWVCMRFSVSSTSDILTDFNSTQMPKLIDNYVLTRKIGAGQYGEVFRGYDRATNNDIAVKSIKRDSVKGKFKELLESEIRVLKSCESSNIIKLYDMKKTTNNFYLIMEYCNDGDLEAYVKRRKYLTEEEAIEILCELINGFHHLYKHNILHRDLKLANILRHDGVVKIADFGFSKILGEEELAQTMLGSPLNMAPQIFQNREYSNKADIYSLGVCFYWMLFGRPPYNARNINQLKVLITKEEFDFPKNINKISEMSKNLIRRMLKANPKERISWEEMFSHEVNGYLEHKIQKEMVLTLTMDGSLSENVCKLYLNQNLVIIHPSEFNKKEEIVSYAVNLVKDGKKKEFQGQILKRDAKEIGNNPHLKRQEMANDDKLCDHIPEDEKISNSIQENTFSLLNERNKIIFLLSVMNEVRGKKRGFDLLFHMVRMSQRYYALLEECIRNKANSYQLPHWKHFTPSPAFKNLEHFLLKEETIVKCELENSSRMAKDTKEPFHKLTRSYCEASIAGMKNEQLDEKNRVEWIHLSHLLDALRIEEIMVKDFDFKHYYCEYGKYEMPELTGIVKNRLKALEK